MVGTYRLRQMRYDLQAINAQVIGRDDEMSRSAMWSIRNMDNVLDAAIDICERNGCTMFRGFNEEQYRYEGQYWKRIVEACNDNRKGKEQEGMDTGRARKKERCVQDNNSETGEREEGHEDVNTGKDRGRLRAVAVRILRTFPRIVRSDKHVQ